MGEVISLAVMLEFARLGKKVVIDWDINPGIEKSLARNAIPRMLP
jgi:hypothetical protein